MAMQLERALGVPASFWNNLHGKHDCVIARRGRPRSVDEESRIIWQWTESGPGEMFGRMAE